MNDRDFLKWIYERLISVHGENCDVDYMLKLKAVIKSTPEKITPNCANNYDQKSVTKAAKPLCQSEAEMPAREYSIEIHEIGDTPGFIKCDRQKQVAISKAREWAGKDGITGVWIHVFFPGDGQKMYLNPNGDYSLTGDSWVGV